MKKLLTVIALAALVATPALAKSKTGTSTGVHATQSYAAAPAGDVWSDNGTAVFSNGQIVGQDPDPTVRLSLRRDNPDQGGF